METIELSDITGDRLAKITAQLKKMGVSLAFNNKPKTAGVIVIHRSRL